MAALPIFLHDHPGLPACPTCASRVVRPSRRRWWERIADRLRPVDRHPYRCEANHRFWAAKFVVVY